MSDPCCLGRLAFLALLAGSLAATTAAMAEEASAVEASTKPATDPARTAALIVRLGSEEFAEREAASDELTRIGLPAFSALQAATLHPDREVRYRSIRILGQIRELDMQRRLEAFLSGKEDAAEYPLPGWKRFEKGYGDNSQSRQLFVDLQRADPELLRSLEDGPRPAAELLTQRIAQHQQAAQFAQQQPTLGQVVALVFVAAETDVTVPDHTMSMVLSYCHQQAVRETMNNPAKKELPRKMIGAAIRRSDGNAASQAMNLAMSYGLDDGMVPALKVLNGGGIVPHMSLYALMTVAKLGDRSHVPLIEKLLDDKSVITRMQENKVIHDIQVRDAALAAAIVLSKQDLKAFFGNRADLQITDPQQVFFNAKLIGFQNDDEREAVHKKWAAYKSQQPKSDAMPPPPSEAK